MRINESLTVVDEGTTALQNLQTTLSTELTGVQADLQTHLGNISPCDNECATLKTQADNLDKEADFNNVS